MGQHYWENEPLTAEREARLLARGEKVWRALAEHPDLSDEARAEIAAAAEHLSTIVALIWNKDLPLDIQRILLGKGLVARAYLAQGACPEIQRELVEDIGCWNGLAANPHLDRLAYEDLLQKSLVATEHYLAIDLASREDLPRAWQETYLASSDPSIREAITTNRHLDPDLWSLHGVESPEHVATAPFAEVEAYVTHPKAIFRAAAASRADLTLDQQRRLAHDDVTVQRTLAVNPSLHPQVVKILARVEDHWIPQKLALNPGVRGRLLALFKGKENTFLENPSLGVEAVREAATDPSTHERLARRTDLPLDVEEIILAGNDAYALSQLGNYTNNPATARKVGEGHHASARRLAWENVCFPWTASDPAALVSEYAPEFFEDYRDLHDIDPETWDALAENWSGTVAELGEACGLV